MSQRDVKPSSLLVKISIKPGTDEKDVKTAFTLTTIHHGSGGVCLGSAESTRAGGTTTRKPAWKEETTYHSCFAFLFGARRHSWGFTQKDSQAQISNFGLNLSLF
ncbi:hypothetical protein XENORESO_022121 [Xenotaenia resolanae]|uniref:Uncharacterized protein n=1 Tax=Xenotaenia resolanae TaxID=208358 RepID=A0ABV0WVF8_9TELE